MKFVYLTGLAGSGKTFVFNALIEKFREEKDVVVIDITNAGYYSQGLEADLLAAAETTIASGKKLAVMLDEASSTLGLLALKVLCKLADDPIFSRTYVHIACESSRNLKELLTGGFAADIQKFNRMYRMQVADQPTLEIGSNLAQRLIDFKKILVEEVDEIDEITDKVQSGDYSAFDVLTSLADLLSDIQIYCASEMAKFGIPLDKSLEIIMQSNFSKMGADGKPIYDERGKLQKGPSYWKPEPKLLEMLKAEAGVSDEELAGGNN